MLDILSKTIFFKVIFFILRLASTFINVVLSMQIKYLFLVWMEYSKEPDHSGPAGEGQTGPQDGHSYWP